jgi:hypothetical protein
MDGRKARDQRLIRIDPSKLLKGFWLINPATNEMHKVLEHYYQEHRLKITADDGDTVIAIETAERHLLVVMNDAQEESDSTTGQAGP